MKLSGHMIPVHWSQEDQTQLKRIQPKSIKIVDFLPSKAVEMFNLSPKSLFVLRDWAKSEQKEDMWNNPAGTGERHADEWADKLLRWNLPIPADQFLVCGINEPAVWHDESALVRGLRVTRNWDVISRRGLELTRQANNPDAVVTRSLGGSNYGTPQAQGVSRTVEYTVHFLRRLAQHGIRGLALNLAVGWPANTGPESPPVWSVYEDVYKEMVRNYEDFGITHMLGLHQYWPIQGPMENWKWLAGRHVQCPWNVPILIGECGMTRRVNENIDEKQAGWKGNLSKDQYMDQLDEYDAMLSNDKRIHSAQVFTWDGNQPWLSSDDTREIMHLWNENADFDNMTNWFDTNTPPEEGFDLRLRRIAQEHQVIRFNPDAAIQKAIFAAGFVPNSPEFTFEHDGVSYIGQRSERLDKRIVRDYYVVVGDWGNVKFNEYTPE